MPKSIYSECVHLETNAIYSLPRLYTIEEEKVFQKLSHSEIIALGWKFERQLNEVEIEAIEVEGENE